MKVHFLDHSDEVKTRLRQNRAGALDTMGALWRETARAEATTRRAVRTGRYRDSLDYESRPVAGTVTVGAGVDYAIWIEEGTSTMAARPIVGDSVTLAAADMELETSVALGAGF